MVARVPGSAAWAGPSASNRSAAQLSGCVMTLGIAHWANELSGNKLPLRDCKALQLAQANTLSLIQANEAALDGGDATGLAGAQSLLTHFESLRALSAYFKPQHAFWNDYRRMIHEQVASGAWEVAGRKGPLPRFDARLIAALGRKASLLRWPASAVGHLAGGAGEAARLDKFFARFQSALQLFDDLSDFEDDHAVRQINAVLSAGRVQGNDPLEVYPAAIRGALRVGDFLGIELASLRNAAPHESGFAGLCALLETRVDPAVRNVRRKCGLRVFKETFGELGKRAAS
jgi:hypothetical protein